MELGHIRDNQVYLDAWLENRFRELWDTHVTDTRFKPSLANPFWHLKGRKPEEQFWFLQLHRPIQLTGSQSPKSLKQLRENVAYAHLTPALWSLLTDETARSTLRQTLLDRIRTGQQPPTP